MPDKGFGGSSRGGIRGEAAEGSRRRRSEPGTAALYHGEAPQAGLSHHEGQSAQEATHGCGSERDRDARADDNAS